MTAGTASALLGLMALPSTDADAAWPTYHGNNARTGIDASQPAFQSVGDAWQSAPLDGPVYAEPLTEGNLVFVATQANSIYALDAATGNVVWQRNLGVAVSDGSLPCGNLPLVGITGTPVIDTASNVLYAAPFVQPGQYLLAALNLSDGSDHAPPRVLSPPAGFDPFLPAVQGQRGALAVSQGLVYIPFGGRWGDCGSYHGWVIAAPTTGSGPLLAYEVSRAPSHGGGVWAPSGLSVDAASNVYIATGNSYPPSSLNDRGEAVIRLSPQLVEQDFFAPSNWIDLNIRDSDIGSVGPALLDGGLLFQGGKDGVGYLLRAAALGGVGGQAFTADVCGGSGIYGGTAYLAPYLYVPCAGRLVALRVTLSPPSFAEAWHVSMSFAGSPIVLGGAVWTIARSGELFAFEPATGVLRFQAALGPVNNFAAPAAAGGRLFVPVDSRIRAFALLSGPFATVTPASLAFDAQPVGVSSSAQMVTVSNTGTGPLVVSAVTTSGDFAQTNSCTTVVAGGSCTIAVTFKATATGPRSGTLSVTDNAVGSPHQVALSGFGAAPGQYQAAAAPTRILDTRSGLGGFATPLGAGQSMDVSVAGQDGVPLTGATAVALNVTVTNPTAGSFLTVYPAGAPRPLASSLNFVGGQTVPNLVVVALGVGGKISAYNASGTVDVVLDVAGWFLAPGQLPAAAGLYRPVIPGRILDTRTATGPLGPAQSRSLSVLSVLGPSGVPAGGVSAVALNVTVTNPTAASFLTVYPAGVARPLASNLNYRAGQTVPNRVVVRVGSNGQVSLYNNQGSVDVVVDVSGWFTDGSQAASGGQFTGVVPGRVLDTRDGTGGVAAPVGPGGTVAVRVAGLRGVPPMSAPTPPTAVVLNVTATNPTASSYLTAYPSDAPRPLASDLNVVTGQTVPNLVLVKLGADGAVLVYNLAGFTDVVIDVVGWFG